MHRSPKEALASHGVAAESKPASTVTATLRAVSDIVIPANRGGGQLGSGRPGIRYGNCHAMQLPLPKQRSRPRRRALLQRTVFPLD